MSPYIYWYKKTLTLSSGSYICQGSNGVGQYPEGVQVSVGLAVQSAPSFSSPLYRPQNVNTTNGDTVMLVLIILIN